MASIAAFVPLIVWTHKWNQPWWHCWQWLEQSYLDICFSQLKGNVTSNRKMGSVSLISSLEQKLRVSYCNHPLSVLCRSSSTISLLTLWITWGQKLGHQVKSKEKLVNTLEVTFWSNHHEYCSKCLPWWFLGQVQNWVTWGQKLGHQAKSKENLVNTVAVTLLKQSSWILLKMFVLMSSMSSSKLGHMGSKTRSPGQISRKPSSLAQNVCIDDF